MDHRWYIVGDVKFGELCLFIEILHPPNHVHYKVSFYLRGSE